jgi:hypothetical protein
MAQWLPAYSHVLRRLVRNRPGLRLKTKRLVTRDALQLALRTERSLQDRISHW